MEVKFESEKFLSELDALCRKYGVKKINVAKDDIDTITFWHGNEWLEIGEYYNGEFNFVHCHIVDSSYKPIKEE